MTQMQDDTKSPTITPVKIALVILSLAVAGAGYYIYVQTTEIASLESSRLAQSETISNKDAELVEATNTIFQLNADLEELRDELAELEEDYEDEQDRNEAFEGQIRDLAGTVTVLDKLSKTDEELLRKYSRVSFLNENYVPERLREIDDEWKYDESRRHELHYKVTPFLEDMLEDALDDGIEMWVVSAYRSFEYQAELKGQYLVTYGTGANAFSADQGFSEHQLGTSVDFTAPGLGGGLNGFGETEAYQWLLDNAHKYGFVLSYPEGNNFYVFEPWHWRFVGEDLAEDLHDDDAHFYDWDQRRIDEYLISIFD